MKKLFLPLFILLISLPVAAQQFTIGANLMAANPQGELEAATDNKLMWGGEISGFGGLGWANIGLNLGYLYRGGETFDEPLSTTGAGRRVTVEVNITHSIVLFQLVGRLQYPEGMFRPYAEGFLGGSYFATQTTIRDRDDTEDDVVNDVNQDDITINRGYAVGTLFRVWQDDQNQMNLPKPAELFIDLKLKNTIGNPAEYLNSSKDIYLEENAQGDSGTIKTRNTKSKTDFLSWHLGVAIVF